MKRVAVIGGGISGLAAALTLTRATEPVEVLLLEASDRLGGVLETVRDGPYLIERSADNFATLIPDALQLSQQWGCDEELIHPVAKNRQALVLNQQRLLPIPTGFSLMQPTRIGSILTTKTLSWSGKLRLLGEYWVARRDVEEDESLESFATRRLGREAYENLVEPIVSGIFTANPSTLSMQATMPQFLEMERRHGGLIRGYLAARKKDAAAVARKASGARYDQFLAPRDGMSSWIGQLAAQLPESTVHLSTPVENLHRGDSPTSWSLETPRQKFEVDGVVIGVPAHHAAKLLQSVHPKAAGLVAGVDYASSVVVGMVLNKSDLAGRLDAFGMIVPRKEGLQTLAVSYSSNKYAGRVPEEQILLRIFLGGALNPEAIDWSDAEIVRVAERELRTILGWNGNTPHWQQVIRWSQAMPQYVVGHVQRMQQLQEILTDSSLKLCGAAYSGVGIPQCVRSGRQAAEELLEHLAPQASSP